MGACCGRTATSCCGWGSLSVGPGEGGGREGSEGQGASVTFLAPGPAPTSIFTEPGHPHLTQAELPRREKQGPGIKAKNPNGLHKSHLQITSWGPSTPRTPC